MCHAELIRSSSNRSEPPAPLRTDLRVAKELKAGYAKHLSVTLKIKAPILRCAQSGALNSSSRQRVPEFVRPLLIGAPARHATHKNRMLKPLRFCWLTAPLKASGLVADA